MHPGLTKMLTFMIFPLLGVMATALTMYFMFGASAATLFSNLATILIIVIAVVYIVVFDSKRRWPGVSWQTRFRRVITMYRD